MASKAVNKVMEWVCDSPGTFAGGATTEEEKGRLELGLRDDEIAEIWMIHLLSILIEDFDAAKNVALYNWLSMDPNSEYASTIDEDLETICSTQHVKQTEGILAGTECVQTPSKDYIWKFDKYPILVGTDLGMGLYGSASAGNLDAGSTAVWRVYFTRRRANASELNRILLKRR